MMNKAQEIAKKCNAYADIYDEMISSMNYYKGFADITKLKIEELTSCEEEIDNWEIEQEKESLATYSAKEEAYKNIADSILNIMQNFKIGKSK